MITRIAVSHYRQIASGQAIELVHPEHRGEPARPASTTGIWGAHGAGKSALIDALDWLQRATVRWSPNDWPPVPRNETARHATVGVELLHDGKVYRYTLEADDKRVVEEKLSVADDSERNDEGENVIFERTTAGLKLGEALRLQPEMALLGRIGPTGTVMLGADLLCEPLCASLKTQLEAMRFVRPLERLDDALQRTIDACSAPGAASSRNGVRRRIAAGLLRQAGIDVGDGERGSCTQVAEVMADAGEGARRAAAIAGAAAEALAEGSLLAVDPIDAGLHVVWQKTLVACFAQQPATRPRRAQLLFTTSSSDLIEEIPRDQVWVAEAESHGTTVSSLADTGETDLHVANTRNRYESGRYGGIPDPNPAALQQACEEAFAAAGE